MKTLDQKTLNENKSEAINKVHSFINEKVPLLIKEFEKGIRINRDNTIAKKDKERIERHGEQLNKIFNTDYDNVTLCKKLYRIEQKAHKMATDYCNGDITIDQWEIFSEQVLKQLDGILGNVKKKVPLLINGDARGYTLKIRDDFMDNWYEKTKEGFYKDWGGFGILAPDFN